MQFLSFKRNVLLLSACQALFWSGLMIGITLSALAGQNLTEHKELATLPAGMLTIVMIAVTRPVSMLMQRAGRRAGFLIGCLSGALGGAVSCYAILKGDFVLFCVGNGILGVYQACGQYYRLAATDRLDPSEHGKAIATVMAGGIVAALVAPQLSIWSKDLFAPISFAGSYLALGVLSVATMLLIAGIAEPRQASTAAASGGRPLSKILRQPIFIAAIANAGIAHGVMILVMVVTPLAMIDCGFGVGSAASVIQWHVLGMFVPAFFSGRLVDRYGAPKVGLVGVALNVVSAAIAASGIEFLNFSIALLLLGVGWNFMYVAGTTLIAASHRPEERGRVQGLAEMTIAGLAAAATFAAAGLLHGLGWAAVNIGAIVLLAISAALTLQYMRRSRLAAAE